MRPWLHGIAGMNMSRINVNVPVYRVITVAWAMAAFYEADFLGAFFFFLNSNCLCSNR